MFIIIGILVTFVMAILVTWEIVSPHEMVIVYHVNKVNVCVVYLHLVFGSVPHWKEIPTYRY